LKRKIFDTVACQCLPIADPVPAKSTVPVEDEYWPRSVGTHSFD
jgi:hypothetical protein